MADEKRVNRAVAWVAAASAVIGALDIVALVLLNRFWVRDDQLGIATKTTTVTYYMDLATEAGLSSVLIQRKDLDDDDIHTIFWLNTILSTVLFLIVWALSPAFGRFEGTTIAAAMLFLYSTKLLYQNLYFVPMALLRRELRFKEVSYVRTIANLGGSIALIAMAATGHPIYCFTAGPLVRIFITGIGMQVIRPWRPRFVWKRGQIGEWLTFAAKTAGSQMLQQFYNTISYQVVGYYFSNAALGAYFLAFQVVMYPVNFISNVVTQVAFPAFARLRGDKPALGTQFLQFSRQNLAVVLPILCGVLVAAPDFIPVVFTKVSDVESAVAIARLLCIIGLLRAVDCLYLPFLDGVGFAGRNTFIAGLTAVVLLSCDVLASKYLGPHIGSVSIAIARVIGYPLVISMHAYLTLDQLGLSARAYLARLFPLVACGIGACALGFGTSFALSGLTHGQRLPILIVVTFGAVLIALDRFVGLGLRAVVAGLKR